MRTVVAVHGRIFIVGTYVALELAKEDRKLYTGCKWFTEMRWNADDSLYDVDFAGKRNGSNAFMPHTPLHATFAGSILSWSDGNKWTHCAT